MPGLFDKIAGIFGPRAPAEAPQRPKPVASPAPRPASLAQSPQPVIMPEPKPADALPDGMITRNFSLAEVSASNVARARGIDNRCPDELMGNARKQAALMQFIRDQLGHPIHVTSWYRSPALNAAVGGVSNSAHASALACDFVCPTLGDALTVAHKVSFALAARDMDFDQLIAEGGWVHLAVGPDRRRQRLTMMGGKYKFGLLTPEQFKGA